MKKDHDKDQPSQECFPTKAFHKYEKYAQSEDSWYKILKEFPRKIGRHGKKLGNDVMGKVVQMFSAFKDPNVPTKYKVQIAACLLYFISPFDAIPDFVPAMGLSDDAAVILFVFSRLVNVMQAHNSTVDVSYEEVKEG